MLLRAEPLGFPWTCADPFLFCVHHDDDYPRGNEALGPDASLDGRALGQDFAPGNAWRMYHGLTVPGFPHHPHRGFETVTVVRKGLVDHADSLGAAARYGRGDAQWLTAGRGILHSEMFPLVEKAGGNPLELFQMWLNLPRAQKLAKPHFSMFWSDAIGRVSAPGVEVRLIAGTLDDVQAPPPPPESWAAQQHSDLAIWTLKLAPGARFELPAARPGTGRSLYFFKGKSLRLDGREVAARQRLVLDAAKVVLESPSAEAELLLLQGAPIGEPVVQYGPFVMTTQDEIRATIAEYQRTQFGGWPWPDDAPTHGGEGRFARHADGKVERPDQ